MTEGAQEWRKDGNGGWRLVARLGGRVDSCLRRNDGGGAGMTEGAQECRKDGNAGRMGMADGGSSHGWAVAWIPASAGMTEGAQEWRKDGNGGRRFVARLGGRVDSCLRRNDGGGAGMTEGWEWRKSLRWSSVRTSESMLTVRPQHLAPRSPDVSRGRLPDSRVRPLTACMRTLLVILSAMLKHHTPWRDLSPNSAH